MCRVALLGCLFALSAWMGAGPCLAQAGDPPAPPPSLLDQPDILTFKAEGDALTRAKVLAIGYTDSSTDRYQKAFASPDTAGDGHRLTMQQSALALITMSGQDIEPGYVMDIEVNGDRYSVQRLNPASGGNSLWSVGPDGMISETGHAVTPGAPFHIRYHDTTLYYEYYYRGTGSLVWEGVSRLDAAGKAGPWVVAVEQGDQHYLRPAAAQ